jgi:predicted permease
MPFALRLVACLVVLAFATVMKADASGISPWPGLLFAFVCVVAGLAAWYVSARRGRGDAHRSEVVDGD